MSRSLSWEPSAGERVQVEMAHSLAALYGAGGALGVVVSVGLRWETLDVGLVLGASLGALAGCLFLIALGERLPMFAFHLLVLAGTVLITVAAYGSGRSGVATFAVFYVWGPLFAFQYFSVRGAVAHLGAIAACYAAVLVVVGGHHVAANVLILTGAAAAAGTVVANLVGQIRSLAFAPLAELRRLWEDATTSAAPASAPDRASIARGELVVLYQPIVALQQTDAVHVEALLRWDHPQRGRVGPAEFIPVAEANGSIGLLGAWVLEDACRQIARWRAGHPHGPALRVSVNLSPRELAQPDLADRITEAVVAAGVSPGSLCLEVTEGAVMDNPDEALETLQRLRRFGVHVAIDDFGTGYSSLSYLKRFPVDWLKVDRSFVEGVDRDASDVAIVRAVVGMARSLGLTVVAEGVERAEQLAAVKALGCDMAQGFYFSEAVSIDALAPVSSLAG